MDSGCYLRGEEQNQIIRVSTGGGAWVFIGERIVEVTRVR